MIVFVKIRTTATHRPAPIGNVAKPPGIFSKYSRSLLKMLPEYSRHLPEAPRQSAAAAERHASELELIADVEHMYVVVALIVGPVLPNIAEGHHVPLRHLPVGPHVKARLIEVHAAAQVVAELIGHAGIDRAVADVVGELKAGAEVVHVLVALAALHRLVRGKRPGPPQS